MGLSLLARPYLLLPGLLCLLVSAASAEMPKLLHYQGMLLDQNGSPVHGSVGPVTFSIYEGSQAEPVWSEQHASIDVSRGIFAVTLGSVSPIARLGFDAPYLIGVKLDRELEMTPRQPLFASPYALRAAVADQVQQPLEILQVGADVLRVANGRVGIGRLSPRDELEVTGVARFSASSGSCANSANGCWATITHAGSGGMVINSRTGGTWADINFQTNGTTRMHLASGGRLGIGTTSPSAPLTVKGAIHVRSAISDELLVEIGEGLDYAEGFNVHRGASIEPGSVLAIDADRPGLLKLSNTPYDTKVAGIVAGANALGSGIRLGVGRFDHDVALAGRVYCNVVGGDEGIRPGDLLTTSSRPGYAMKATDVNRRQGAILGKSMESLGKGRTGKVLVLVTLQ